MSGEDDDLLDDEFDEDDSSDSESDMEESPRFSGIDARRKVEDRLEELRMKKLLADYDFDLE